MKKQENREISPLREICRNLKNEVLRGFSHHDAVGKLENKVFFSLKWIVRIKEKVIGVFYESQWCTYPDNLVN